MHSISPCNHTKINRKNAQHFPCFQRNQSAAKILPQELFSKISSPKNSSPQILPQKFFPKNSFQNILAQKFSPKNSSLKILPQKFFPNDFSIKNQHRTGAIFFLKGSISPGFRQKICKKKSLKKMGSISPCFILKNGPRKKKS